MVSAQSATFLRIDQNLDFQEEILTCPFPSLTVDLTDEELRESAFEIFLACHRPALMGKQMISSSKSAELSRSRSRRKSFTAFSLIGCFRSSSTEESMGKYSRMQTNPTMSDIEIMKMQMDISDKAEARTSRALAKQNEKVGGKSAALFLPLALLSNTRSSEFSSHVEYEQWKRRQLKILEAEMYSHPAFFETFDRIKLLNQIPQVVQENGMKLSEFGKSSEALKNLTSACMAVPWEAFHYPLNVHLYQKLLMSIFDSLDESAFADNCNQIMALIKETWTLLGIKQGLHSICMMWVLFRQFVVAGGIEVNLLMATEKAMKEFVPPSINVETIQHRQLLQSVITSILRWVEPNLLDYWGKLSTRNSEVMKSFVNLAVLGTQIVRQLGNGDEQQSMEGSKLEKYVQSSLQSIFWKICKINDNSTEASGLQPLALVDLAKSIEEIALEEQQNFSPLLEHWLPNAASVAARTLHKCYGMELKRYLANISILDLDAVKVLQSAAKLERAILTMIMQDEPQSDMTTVNRYPIVPFASDVETTAALQEWLKQRLELLLEWSARNIEQETWAGKVRKEPYASSAVELLRIVDETSDAFLKLPVSQNLELLQDFTAVLDEALDQYVHLILAGCGSKEDYTQNLFLSKCKDLSMSIFSKINQSFRTTFEMSITTDARVWPDVNDESFTCSAGPVNLGCLCIRMNTMNKIFTEVEFLEKKLRYAWQDLPPDPFTRATPDLIATHVKFERTRESCNSNLKKLYDITAYKIVFGDMRGIFLERLYSNGVSLSRIEPILEQLNLQLEKIAEIVSDRLRNHVVNHIMMACYDCFLQIISKECFSPSEDDVLMLEEDLTALKDLFISNGEGLPKHLVEKAAEPVDQFLSSLSVKTKDSPNQGASIEPSISNIMKPKPKTLGPAGQHQRSSSSNSLSSVLGHTCHLMASNLVMRTYSFTRR